MGERWGYWAQCAISDLGQQHCGSNSNNIIITPVNSGIIHTLHTLYGRTELLLDDLHDVVICCNLIMANMGSPIFQCFGHQKCYQYYEMLGDVEVGQQHMDAMLALAIPHRSASMH